MNKRSTTRQWFTTVVMIVIGTLLIIWHERLNILDWIVIAMGILFILPSLYTLIAAIGARRQAKADGSQRTAGISTIITSIAGVALGVWMIIEPGFFVGVMAYLFAAILILFGIIQIVNNMQLSRSFIISWLFYIVPVLMVAAGCVILLSSVRTMNSVVVLITGIMLVVCGVNRALTFSMTHPAGQKPQDRIAQ